MNIPKVAHVLAQFCLGVVFGSIFWTLQQLMAWLAGLAGSVWAIEYLIHMVNGVLIFGIVGFFPYVMLRRGIALWKRPMFWFECTLLVSVLFTVWHIWLKPWN